MIVPDEPPTSGVEPESINSLAYDFWNSSILRAGIKLDIFHLLDREGLTYDQVAQRVGAAPRYIQAFLDACVVLGLLERGKDNKYHNSLSTATFLVKGKREYQGDLVLHRTNHWETWGRLDELIKEGKPLPPFQTGYVDAATYWTDYLMGQHNRAAAGQAYHLVQNVDLTNSHKLLDLGGGAASYSIALCGANRRLSAVVVDRREALALANDLVEQHSLGGQITLLEGDFNTIKLEKDYDVVLISGIVLGKSEEECRGLFNLAYDVMEPGGRVIVQDFMQIDPSPERSRVDTLTDLYVLAAYDPGAEHRSGDEVTDWLQNAGFHNPREISLPTDMALILAQKPSPEEALATGAE